MEFLKNKKSYYMLGRGKEIIWDISKQLCLSFKRVNNYSFKLKQIVKLKPQTHKFQEAERHLSA